MVNKYDNVHADKHGGVWYEVAKRGKSAAPHAAPRRSTGVDRSDEHESLANVVWATGLAARAFTGWRAVVSAKRVSVRCEVQAPEVGSKLATIPEGPPLSLAPLARVMWESGAMAKALAMWKEMGVKAAVRKAALEEALKAAEKRGAAEKKRREVAAVHDQLQLAPRLRGVWAVKAAVREAALVEEVAKRCVAEALRTADAAHELACLSAERAALAERQLRSRRSATFSVWQAVMGELVCKAEDRREAVRKAEEKAQAIAMKAKRIAEAQANAIKKASRRKVAEVMCENDARFAARKVVREAAGAVATAQRAVMRERRSLQLRGGGAVGDGKKAVASFPLSPALAARARHAARATGARHAAATAAARARHMSTSKAVALDDGASSDASDNASSEASSDASSDALQVRDYSSEAGFEKTSSGTPASRRGAARAVLHRRPKRSKVLSLREQANAAFSADCIEGGQTSTGMSKPQGSRLSRGVRKTGSTAALPIAEHRTQSIAGHGKYRSSEKVSGELPTGAVDVASKPDRCDPEYAPGGIGDEQWNADLQKWETENVSGRVRQQRASASYEHTAGERIERPSGLRGRAD